MRILWSVNTVSPNVSKQLGIKSVHSISWVEAMGEQIKKRDDVCLAIVVPGNEDALRKVYVDAITYYILPQGHCISKAWREIVSDFRPDIIHVYGTERRHNLPLFSEINKECPIIISLQGIINEYEKHYYGGLSRRDIIKNYTIGDVVLRQGIFAGKRKFKKQIKIERFMLCSAKYVEGRSSWDRVMSECISDERKYFTCPRMIRKPFFEVSREGAQVENRSIFVHQGAYPIKGLHFMIEALGILKTQYPNIKLYISGTNFLKKQKFIKRILEPGYIKYIKGMIDRQGLTDNIVFTGYLNAAELAHKLSRVQVCVVPSAIENAPNSLAEAMLVGTPCVASFVGGNAEMLDNGLAGYLYRFSEAPMLADIIASIFENPQESEIKSQYAKQLALKRHDPMVLENTLLDIYQNVITDFSFTNNENV